MSEKLYLRETVIVEGRYDRIKLSEFISSPIVETGGFRVFSDKEKQELIRRVAERRGILIMTDVDSAGFVIRNFLRGIVPADRIKHCYIPTVTGVERRKAQPSKEGKLGVEGIDCESLIKAIRSSGAEMIGEDSISSDGDEITKADFYTYGLTGSVNSAVMRKQILRSLGLPEYLTANAMISALNCLFTKAEFEDYLNKLDEV